MRRVVAVGVGVCLFLWTSVQAETVNVSVLNFSFSPKNVTIDQGDTVRWIWVSGNHTVTNGLSPVAPNVGILFDVPLTSGAPIFSYTFNDVGSFAYFCRVHFGMNMTGSVTVEAVETVDPDNVYVDASFGGTEVGTSNSPFRTLAAALLVANDDATIHISSNEYPETFFEGSKITQSLTLTANGEGVVRIGTSQQASPSSSGFQSRYLAMLLTLDQPFQTAY